MKNAFKYILVIVVILLLGIFLFNKNSHNNLKKDEVETVKIGMVSFPGYAPLYLANEKNLFDNINVKLFRIESIGDLRAAMNSGKIDMYIATPDIFQSIERQEPNGIGFLAIDESYGADGVAISGNINSISDLKDKKVGAEPGFPPYFVLQYMLHKNNMSLKDIDFKDMASQDAGNAFVAGQLDAVGTYEPYLSKSVSLKSESKILISSADLPGLIVDIIFANKQLVEQKPEVLEKVSDGWFKAVAYYKEHEDESLKIMGKSFGVSAEEMKDIKSGISWLDLKDNQKLFDKTKENNLFETFNLVADILSANNTNNYRVKPDDKLTNKIIIK